MDSLEILLQALRDGRVLTMSELFQAVQIIAARQAEAATITKGQQIEINELKEEVTRIVTENILLTAFVKEQGLADEFKAFINNYGDLMQGAVN